MDGIDRGFLNYGGDAFDPVTDLFFGGRADLNGQRFFGGELDEIRLYSRALSGEEIDQLLVVE